MEMERKGNLGLTKKDYDIENYTSENDTIFQNFSKDARKSLKKYIYIYIFFARGKNAAFPLLGATRGRRETGRREEGKPISESRDELLFYFSVIENQGARRLSIILEGGRPLFPAGQSDFKNFRVSFAT